MKPVYQTDNYAAFEVGPFLPSKSIQGILEAFEEIAVTNNGYEPISVIIGGETMTAPERDYYRVICRKVSYHDPVALDKFMAKHGLGAEDMRDDRT